MAFFSNNILYLLNVVSLLQAGMRSYLLNGGGVTSTPPPGPGLGPPRHHRPGIMSGRASSSSLPRSPEQDTSLGTSLLTSGLGTGSVSGQSGHGSLGSHSSHEVSYMNIYQNTNHHNLYVSLTKKFHQIPQWFKRANRLHMTNLASYC